MSYYPDKNQIPTGFEEWSFTNMPEDGEIVEVLSYGCLLYTSPSPRDTR